MSDPLAVFPAEIVLRILDFAPISSVAALTRLTRSWHEFIDETHQDAIYSLSSKTSHPAGFRDLSFLSESKSFAHYFENTSSWKDLCRRQTMLARNWNLKEPISRETVFQVGTSPVWRFRADFKRRIFLSTSEHGGLSVTDMDTGKLLWKLSDADVLPYAHLEYQDGTAVFDRPGNAVEVWKTDLEGQLRGDFKRIAILPHDCQVRGFQLSYDTLCVVSTQGRGFVYDMKTEVPRLKTQMKIEDDAVGHLDQDADGVMYCIGKKGYHVHDKASGTLLGTILPKHCKKFYHICHAAQIPDNFVNAGRTFSSLPSTRSYLPEPPRKDRFTPIVVDNGSLPRMATDLGDDVWGAALLSGSLMVGVSDAGRVIICPDWRLAVRDYKAFEASAVLIECEAGPPRFNAGSWLSVRDHRIMFEVRDWIYVVALDDCGLPHISESSGSRPSYTFPSCAAVQLATPVSFMALFDDCIMTAYGTLGWRRGADRAEEAAQQHHDEVPIFPTKTIRILNLAPSLDGSDAEKAEAGIPMVSDRDAGTTMSQITDMLDADDDGDDDGDGL